MFKDGREEIEDDECVGCSSTSRTHENLLKLRDLLNTDRYARVIAHELNFFKMIVHEIVTLDLNMRKVKGKLLHKILTNDQKTRQHLLLRFLRFRFLNSTKYLLPPTFTIRPFHIKMPPNCKFFFCQKMNPFINNFSFGTLP